MATSLGYVLMNWTSTFSKKKNRQKKKGNAVTKAHTNAKETKCCQTTGKYIPTRFSNKFWTKISKSNEGEKLVKFVYTSISGWIYIQ